MMSVKEEKAVALFSRGYNCAQAVLGAFCEEGGLDTNTAFRLANGFGGGMRCGEVCGAATGAILAIGLQCGFYIENDVAQKGFCNRKTYEFIEKFRQETGSALCRELLGVDVRSPEDLAAPTALPLFKTVCPDMVATAVHILENMNFEK